MNMFETKNVSRYFEVAEGEPFYALKNVTMNIPEGRLTILRGRSGSGKTTLMNLLGALDKPSEGQIWFDGQEITALDEDACSLMRRKKVGFVFQSVALIPMMTAYENVEYALRLSGYQGAYGERVEECLKMVGLSARMHHMPEELSGGEQQRVAIARAIAHKPKVVFADEPTAELDTNTGLQVMKIFKNLVDKDHVTVVMTTHDVELMEIGDKVFELEDGEIISER